MDDGAGHEQQAQQLRRGYAGRHALLRRRQRRNDVYVERRTFERQTQRVGAHRHYAVSQGHSRHGGAGRRFAGAGRQRQQLEPALDGTVRPADQPVDHVNADADAPKLGGRRDAVLFQHGRQADDRGRGGRGERRPGDGGRPVRGRFGRRIRHPLAVQVDGHVRMIAVVDLQRLAVEQYRTFSLVAQLVDAGADEPPPRRPRRKHTDPRLPIDGTVEWGGKYTVSSLRLAKVFNASLSPPVTPYTVIRRPSLIITISRFRVIDRRTN
uniref:Uncharacterized protein n=1 Tax=Sipha flava TaxID=143950 RepID=A0A2S2R3H4_9HEMI